MRPSGVLVVLLRRWKPKQGAEFFLDIDDGARAPKLALQTRDLVGQFFGSCAEFVGNKYGENPGAAARRWSAAIIGVGKKRARWRGSARSAATVDWPTLTSV
jgi:hypothetical protein